MAVVGRQVQTVGDVGMRVAISEEFLRGTFQLRKLPPKELTMTTEEFNALRRETPPAATSSTPGKGGTADLRAALLNTIVPHLPRCAELLIRAVQSGDVQAATTLVELWRWARER